MIKLNDEYFITFDESNIIINKMRNNIRGGKRKSDAIAYFGSLKHLAQFLLDDNFLANKSSDIETLEDIIKYIEEFKEEISNKIEEIPLYKTKWEGRNENV